MTATDFLKEKGIILEGNKDWKVTFEDGRQFSIVSLMEEYSTTHTHEIMMMKNKL